MNPAARRLTYILLFACTMPSLAFAVSFEVFKGNLSLSQASQQVQGFQDAARENLEASYRGELWYRLRIDATELPRVDDLAVHLGRISDADETYWNGRLVGSTGTFGGRARIFPHIDRVYRIPEVLPGENILLVRVVKIAGDPTGAGITEGVPRFGGSAELKSVADKRYFIHTILTMLLGFMIFAFGVYHLFLYFHLPQRASYLDFGACMVCFGTFAFCRSFWPYEVVERESLVLAFHGLGSFWGLYFFGRYHLGTTGRVAKIVNGLELGVAAGFSIWMLAAPTFDEGLRRYFFWYLVLLPSLLFLLGRGIYFFKRDREKRFATISAGAFVAALIYDVLVTNRVFLGEYWSVQTFLLSLVAGILFLGRDFAHAFLNVEETVEKRTQDLKTANEQLKVLEAMKSRFFANISHDFKTPIAIAFANIEEAKRQAGSIAGKALDAADRSLNKLQGMVLDLLDTVRGESGALSIRWESAPIGRLVRLWAKPYEALCVSKDLELQCDVEVADTFQVPVDVGKLERVFSNLMSNALKFTETGGIRVVLRSDSSQVYLEVNDTGPGVPKAEREKVFDRYFQGLNTTLRDHGGSGIGLSFVSEVVSAMNGKVWVEDGVPRGARFVVALPVSQDVELTGEHVISDEDSRVAPLKGSMDVPYPDTRPLQLRAELPSILVVEDNPEVAQVVVGALKEDFNIFFARHGGHALEMLEVIQVDCVVSDIMMPEVDGTELLKRIRATPRLKPVPVIMLTSMGEDANVIEHLKLGAQDYVAKPFRRDILLARVKAQVDMHRLRGRLLSSDKMVTLGILSAGIAHEIKNPLLAALSYLGGLEKNLAPTKDLASSDANVVKEAVEALAKKVDRIDLASKGAAKAVERIQNIVESMRGYASGSTELSEINLVEAVDEALTMLEAKRKTKDVILEHKKAPDLTVLGYASINQALVNVLDNALDAVSSPDGKVVVETALVDSKAIVTVTDNGSGISPDLLTRIFDPFMTTKSAGQGTGLGLYISRDIVELQHGGKLSVSSQVGAGTTFRFELPLEAPEPVQAGTIPFHGGELTVV